MTNTNDIGGKIFEARCGAIKENLQEKLKKTLFKSLSEAVYEVFWMKIIHLDLLPGTN